VAASSSPVTKNRRLIRSPHPTCTYLPKHDAFAPGGAVVVAAAREATSSIPIVAHDLESDPVANGWVKGLARSGGNMTGFFLDTPEISGKQLGLLREVLPHLSRIAVLGVPGLNGLQFAATEAAARAVAVEAEILEVRSYDDFAGAMAAAMKRRAEAR
jgi:putative ABC transport system substrate-binding protein